MKCRKKFRVPDVPDGWEIEFKSFYFDDSVRFRKENRRDRWPEEDDELIVENDEKFEEVEFEMNYFINKAIKGARVINK